MRPFGGRTRRGKASKSSHPTDLDDRALLLAGALAEQEEHDRQHDAGAGDRGGDRGPLFLDLALQLILDRLKALDQMENYGKIKPYKGWDSSRDGGPRRIIREDMI